jgi:hypothetical protein
MKKEYADDLDYIVVELNKIPDLWDRIAVSSTSEDGRDTAKSGEDIVKDELKKMTLPSSYSMGFSKPRYWYDFIINKALPGNIKITTGLSPDNAGSKLGIYFACTGYLPDNDPKMAKYVSNLERDISLPHPNIEEVDYVYFVLNRNTKHIHWIGARQLVELQANGKNQPFQINWSKNITPVDRSVHDARKFLLGVFRESAKKASEAFCLLDDAYNRLFGDDHE